VVTSPDAIVKGLGSGGARGDDQASDAVSAPLQDPSAQA
jgi:hypothetical protein